MRIAKSMKFLTLRSTKNEEVLKLIEIKHQHIEEIAFHTMNLTKNNKIDRLIKSSLNKPQQIINIIVKRPITQKKESRVLIPIIKIRITNQITKTINYKVLKS